MSASSCKCVDGLVRDCPRHGAGAPAPSVTDDLRKVGQAMIDIANALEGHDPEACIRILRATAILHGIDLSAVGLAEAPARKGKII